MGTVAKVYTVAITGFDGHIVEVESDSSKGLPALQIVGLGNKAIDEARERVRSAITNSLLEFPARRITINLAPAQLPKDGTHYDLPIALAILVSSGQLRQENVHPAAFAGEVSLDGNLRPVKGAVSLAETAKRHGLQTLYLPVQNVEQASLVDGIEVVGVTNIKELFLHLKGELKISQRVTPKSPIKSTASAGPLLDDIVGQEQAKRALVIAAAGHHNILFTGSPGAGKTMLAKTLPGLLPALTDEERITVTKLHSLSGEITEDIISVRPFRAPHHSASRTSLIGGGTRPKPGDISLAHLGVLFLDEIPEYPRSSLEALRQPLEDKEITISRADGYATYPADFMLVATMNPCPCGFLGDSQKECSCSSTQILHYQKKLSGPLLDRIDLVVTVPRVSHDDLLHRNTKQEKQHLEARNLISISKNTQANRYKSSYKYNGNLSSSEIKNHLTITPEVKVLLSRAAEKLNLSARAYFRVLKVARTIADLDGHEAISEAHVAEALQYRQKA